MKAFIRPWMLLAIVLLIIAAFSPTEARADLEFQQDTDESWFVDLPAWGSHQLIVPDNISSFKVYDDGGKNGNYTHLRNGLVEFYAQEGCRFRVSGTVAGEERLTHLKLYEKNDYSDWHPFYSTADGQPAQVSFITSGTFLAMHFQDHGQLVFSGLDLTVEVIPPDPHGISINYFEGGYVECDKGAANPDEIVTLNVVPDEGYLLKNFYVIWVDGIRPEFVETSKNAGWWGKNEPITFKMPAHDVYVIAEFEKSSEPPLYEMPKKNGIYYVYIPDDVVSFDMKRDFDWDIHPPKGSRAKIIVIAPEGRNIRVTGYTGVELSIWEGSIIVAGPAEVTGKSYLWALKDTIQSVYYTSLSNVLTITYLVPKDDLYGISLKFDTGFPRNFSLGKAEHARLMLSEQDKYDWYTDGGYIPGHQYGFLAWADEGYEINNVYVEYNGGIAEAQYDNRSGEYRFTMPFNDCVARVITEPVLDMPSIMLDYNLNLFYNTGGSVTSEKDWYYMNDTVTFTVTPDDGYELRNDETTFYARAVSSDMPVEMTKTGENTWQFTMPADNVNIYAYFDPIIQAEITVRNDHTINILPSQYGTVSTSGETVQNGDIVTLYISANPGYELESLSVRCQSQEENVVTEKNDFGTWSFVMPDDEVIVEAAFRNILSHELTGSGTEQAPYLIQSADDWQKLSIFIMQGGSTEGLFFKLTNDIQVSKMLGTDQTPFAGTFDGDNHTLNTQMECGADHGSVPAAPFRNISGATIKNLQADGRVSGGEFSSGLICFADGENLIQNCLISTEITATSTCSGFVGNGGDSHTTMIGCVFSGKFPEAGQAGIFLANSQSGAVITLSNCVDRSGLGCPVGWGDGTVTAENTYVINPDQLTAAHDAWAGKGTSCIAVDISNVLEAALTEDSTGFSYNGFIYAPAGEFVKMSAQTMNGENPSSIILLSEDGETRTQITPIEDIFTFNMPEENTTLHRGYLVNYVNEDDSLLQSGKYILEESPEYTGATPVRPDDEHNYYVFEKWNPDPGPVTGDTTYKAVYAYRTNLSEGDNTVHVAEYETVRCLFIPQTDGDYRFWSTGDEVSLELTLYNGDQIIGRNNRNGIDLYNFDLTTELEGGRIYAAEITSLHSEGDVAISVEKVTMHTLTLTPYDNEKGYVSCPAKAREGQILFIEAIPEDGYGVQEISLTDAEGNAILMADDGAYYMPASDVNVTVRFAQTHTMGFTADSHINYLIIDVDGLIAAPEDYPAAVPGTEVRAAFLCEEGYSYERVTIAGKDGSIIPYQIVFNDNMQAQEIVFRMPDQFVMVHVAEQYMIHEVPAADFTLPGGLKEIGEAAFEGGNLHVVYIPDGCTSIGAGAFKDCENLTAVRIPRNCIIREGAFDECPSVTLYSFPGSPTEAWCLVHANCTFAAIAPPQEEQ